MGAFYYILSINRNRLIMLREAEFGTQFNVYRISGKS